tara:strand:- start:378 stop:569 length:192 start_codon:yes stop_codon:yes gene_type:complete
MDNRKIAELIVQKVFSTRNDYDAVDEVIEVLDKQFTKRKSTVPSAPITQLTNLFKSFSPTKIS